jgi:putative endonuclease
MAENNETGKQGELTAESFLKEQGYIIIEKNWRFRRFELDIIATKDNELIIVEVKTRSENYLLAPEDAVDRKKIHRIVIATDAYIRKKNIGLPVRFDVLCLVKKGDKYIIESHIEDAFYAPAR